MARAEGRNATETIGANLEKAVAEERRLLAARSTVSESNGRILLAIDLAGVVLILVLATVLTLSTRPLKPRTAGSLSATRATNEALEAAVAERTEHLVAAHEELRHSTAVHAEHLQQHGGSGARDRRQGRRAADQSGCGNNAALRRRA